jgi:obg-like ATPase 1
MPLVYSCFLSLGTYTDDSIAHVEGDVDPIRDIEIIHEELRLKDEEFLLKQVEIAKKNLRGNESDKGKKFELETIQKALAVIQEDKRDIRQASWSNKEVEVINPLQLLTAKSVVYLANMKEEDFSKKKNKWYCRVSIFIFYLECD